MKKAFRWPVAALVLAGAGAGAAHQAIAADAPAEQAARVAAPSAASPNATAPMVASDAAVAAGEPNVKHTVIDDGLSRIDELRVRGQVQRITVDPKGRLPSYEIITGDGSRDLSDGANTSRGAAGKRVWNVLRF